MLSKNKLQKSYPKIIFGKNISLPLEDAGNTFLVGAARTEKGRAYIRPNVLQFNSNYIVTDNHCEHLQCLAPSLIKNGYSVKAVSFGPKKSTIKKQIPNISVVNYNPFHYLKEPTDIALMAEILSYPIEDPYIKPLCKHLLMACIGYICNFETVKRQSFPVLVEYVKLCLSDISTFKKLFNQGLVLYSKAFWSTSYQIFSNESLEVQLFVVGKLFSYLEPYGMTDDDGSYIYETSDTIEIKDFTNNPSALFIEISTNDKTFALGQTLFLSQLIHHFFRTEKSTRITHFLLDEFFNIPLIPNFKNILAVSKTYNMIFSVLYQDMNQLYSVYGEIDAKKLLKEFHTYVYFGGWIRDAAQYFCDLMNEFTPQNKKLKIMPEILLQYPRNKMLCLHKRQPPIVGKKYLLEKHPNFIKSC